MELILRECNQQEKKALTDVEDLGTSEQEYLEEQN